MKKNLLTFIFVGLFLIATSSVMALTQPLVVNGSYISKWIDQGCLENYMCVDELGEGDGNTLKAFPGSNAVDVYAVSDINPDAEDIEYIDIIFNAKKLSVWSWNSGSIKTILLIDKYKFLGEEKELSLFFEDYYERYYTNPLTGEKWTKEEVNNLLIGIVSIEGGVVEKVHASVTYDINTCEDTDGYNLLTQGTIFGYKDNIPYEYTDYCVYPSISDPAIVEYTCLASEVYLARRNTCHEISPTSVCFEGRCI